MKTEFEATFLNINKDEMRAKLKEVGAELVKPEFLQKRFAFDFPVGHEIKGGWARVRDENDRITMSIKIVNGENIEDQKEIEIKVDSMDKAAEFLEAAGFIKKAYQETKREKWEMEGCEITIDEWPFLEPFVEIESDSEEKVKIVSGKIGFDYTKARFASADTFYSEKYQLSEDVINNTSLIVFNMENPFIKK